MTKSPDGSTICLDCGAVNAPTDHECVEILVRVLESQASA